MKEFQLYQQYATRFGHTFSESDLSGKSWKAAQTLMRQALDGTGHAVTCVMIRQHMRTMTN